MSAEARALVRLVVLTPVVVAVFLAVPLAAAALRAVLCDG